MWGSGDGGDATYLQAIIEGLRELNITRPCDGREIRYTIQCGRPTSFLYPVPEKECSSSTLSWTEKGRGLGKVLLYPFSPTSRAALFNQPSGEASATMVRDEHGLVQTSQLALVVEVAYSALSMRSCHSLFSLTELACREGDGG